MDKDDARYHLKRQHLNTEVSSAGAPADSGANCFMTNDRFYKFNAGETPINRLQSAMGE